MHMLPFGVLCELILHHHKNGTIGHHHQPVKNNPHVELDIKSHNSEADGD